MRFDGDVTTTWLIQSEAMRLASEFTFIDSRNDKWIAPQGLMTDGASIPRPFWTILGGPFEGPYRRAAVMHDAAYQAHGKMRTAMGWWRLYDRSDADRMLYEGMLTDGCPKFKALAIYYAVRAFGWLAWKRYGGNNG